MPNILSYCKTDQANHEQCASYDTTFVVLLQIAKFLDDHSGTVVAFFTAALWLSTHRLWRETKRLASGADQQSRDMRDSIAQATRAADEMGKVAGHVGTSADTTVIIAKTQKEFWLAQMRAYICVDLNGAFVQDREKGNQFQAVMFATNAGNTPAIGVRVSSSSAIMAAQLPDDFAFPLAQIEETGPQAFLGPRQGTLCPCPKLDWVEEDQVSDVRLANGLALYAWGRIEYQIVGGEKHYTNFARRIVWGPQGAPIGWNLARHNDAN